MSQGDAVIQMPSDDTRRAAFALEQDAPPKGRGGITRLTVDVPAAHHSSDTPKPARWRTPEFLLYYVVFAFAVPWMIYVPVSLSSESHSNYNLYRHRLAPGWLFGRQVDNSDAQYRSFRSGLSALGALIAMFFALRYVYLRPILRVSRPSDNLHRLPFYLAFSLLMLAVLHGTSALKVLLILTANYALARASAGKAWAVAATWIVNGAVLFANERYSGYTFGSVHPALGSLDSWRGVYPRWHVSFNITMLRLVSFNVDYHWACRRNGSLDSGAELSDKQRTTTFHPVEVYTYRNYLVYTLYAPLYIAGPIMTFNDFMWQLARPRAIAARNTVGYAGRFLATLLTMEFILHFMYVVAIKDAHAWSGTSPAELSMIGFWNLIIVWLKLLLPWRFFRLWALMDGIDPPENMVRCMANNYSTLGFWRSWHRSYNLWVVRYIYIPLGGTKHLAVSSLLVFTFVALWHDLSFRLLAWGWLVTLFILPEITARKLLPPSKFGGHVWYRHVCAAGAVVNVLMMMAANLVGFAVGTDGMRYMAHEIAGSWGGLRFLFTACACLYVGVQVMFEYREEELRRGINRRC
ncbi:MBOAT-domain-containing protein [Auriscalpium vulgare]|uniref:MBOAT-domain-containing protein n=1 Tax=Auriscalpium vulgare TaxID=40419 RepID=A0ACB8S317_9AGAM|nr:MBOAT-domain-containing protein [Auriscalpium vulgare]